MTAIQSQHLWDGFSDPVLQAQETFRSILTALSEPGEVVGLTVPTPANGLCEAAWATMLSLADGDTPVWVSPGLRSGGLTDSLRFHCGATVVSDTEKAAFAILLVDEWVSIDTFATGDDADPHRSATLIVQVTALGSGSAYTLSGPGIETCKTIRITGLSELHQRLLAANRQRFPGGVDLLLVSGDQLLGLPRTTQIKSLKENC